MEGTSNPVGRANKNNDICILCMTRFLLYGAWVVYGVGFGRLLLPLALLELALKVSVASFYLAVYQVGGFRMVVPGMGFGSCEFLRCVVLIRL